MGRGKRTVTMHKSPRRLRKFFVLVLVLLLEIPNLKAARISGTASNPHHASRFNASTLQRFTFTFPFIGCWMLDVRCWMFDVGCSLIPSAFRFPLSAFLSTFAGTWNQPNRLKINQFPHPAESSHSGSIGPSPFWPRCPSLRKSSCFGNPAPPPQRRIGRMRCSCL